MDTMTNQSQNNKRIARNTVMLYIRMMLLMLINLYTSRIVLRVLGVEDYGLYSIVGAIVIFLGFINISMSAASQRFLSFYHGKGDAAELSSTFNSILIVQAIISLLIFLIGETLGILYIERFLNVDAHKIPLAHIVYQFSLFSFIAKTITVPYHASIIANERMNVFALFSIVEALLQLAVVFVLQLLADSKLVMYALMMFLSVLTTQMCYRIYSIRHFEECKFRKNWNRIIVRDIFSYSGWNLLGSLSSVAIDQGINMVLNSFFGVVVNAARGIAFQVSGAIASLSGNFQQALNPQIVKSYAEREHEKMHCLMMNGTRFCFYLLLILSVPVWFNMRELLELWLGEAPEYTETFCKLVLINALLTALSGSLLMGAMATGNIRKYQLVVASINLLNIPVAIIGLHIYPNPYLTVYIMITLSAVAFMARLVLTSQMTGMSISLFLKRSILPAVAVCACAIIWSVGFDSFIVCRNTVMLFGKMIVIFAGVVIMIAAIGVTRNERAIAFAFIMKKIKKHR